MRYFAFLFVLYWTFFVKIPDTNVEQCNIITELGKCPVYAYWTILYDIVRQHFELSSLLALYITKYYRKGVYLE